MHVEVIGVPEGDSAVAEFIIAAGHGTRKPISVTEPKQRPLIINITRGDESDLDFIQELGLRARMISKRSTV